MLNHRVTLSRRSTGVDAAGQPSETWGDVATVWANVRFQTGAEVLRAGAEVAIKRASVQIRARSDVDESWRLQYLGTEFEIKSALPSDDRQFLYLVCEALK